MKALIALATMALTAATPAAPPVWQGVWTGTVGTLAVRVCLARRSETYTVGSYYYLSRLRTIKLDEQGTSRDWLEGEEISNQPPRPRWRFETIAADGLAGSWNGGGRDLSFRLARVRIVGGVDPCGSLAFNAPRLRPLRVTSTRAERDGVAYTKLTFDAGPAFEAVELHSFALDGDALATRRINARLRREMPIAAAQGGWFDCVAGGLDAQGVDGDYDATVEPELITPRWLAAAESVGGYCGGAHPSSGTTSLTFDRTTGATIDLNDWLTPAAIQRERLTGVTGPVVTVRPVLRRLILTQARDLDAECRPRRWRPSSGTSASPAPACASRRASRMSSRRARSRSWCGGARSRPSSAPPAGAARRRYGKGAVRSRGAALLLIFAVALSGAPGAAQAGFASLMTAPW